LRHGEHERQVAEDTIAFFDAAGFWPGKIMTEISEAGPFLEAEAEDQDYLQRYPDSSQFPQPAPEAANTATAT
jgi:peptide-methionine (S)-S-oxide reductase